MKKEEIKNAAMNASKNYGYEWVMSEFEYEEGEDILKGMEKEMDESGFAQVGIFGGEEPYYALGEDLVDVMEEGEIFSESNVYNWISQGRIEAWKELFGKTVGYFCNGYQGYVFSPDRVDADYLKMKGEVVLG